MNALYSQLAARHKVRYALVIAVVLIFLAGCSSPAPAPVTPEPTVEMVPKLGVTTPAIQVQFKEGDSKTITQNITFMNEGEGVMVWAVRKTQPWIWMNEVDGALEKGYSKNLAVFIAPSGKEPGTYTDTITIEGTGTRNSPQNVVVTMVITPADQPGSDSTVVKKTVPPPPWDYNEYVDDNYHFRLRYPKDYQAKMIAGTAFGAASSAGKQQADTIMVRITGAYAVDNVDAVLEWVKDAIHAVGGKANPKLVSSDNITLADGVTPGFEFVYDSKSTTTISYECYVYGVQKGSRYIMFGAVCPLAMAPDKMQLWKEIAHTLEFIDKN